MTIRNRGGVVMVTVHFRLGLENRTEGRNLYTLQLSLRLSLFSLLSPDEGRETRERWTDRMMKRRRREEGEEVPKGPTSPMNTEQTWRCGD